jgi:hypothetical protein
MHAAPIAVDGASTAHRLLLIGGEEAIHSGYYTLNDQQQKLGVLFFPLSYDLTADSIVSAYAYGSIGYGAAQYTSEATTPWMKLFAFKLGGGLRYALTESSDLRIGGAYQLAHFAAADPVSGHGYEAVASFAYHPWFGEWNPYLEASTRYSGTAVDFQGTASTTRSLISKLKAGVITPTLARPFGLPMKLEFYGTALSLHGNMARVLGTCYLWSVGATAYVQSPVLQQWVSDITLGVQIVRGEKFKGLSVGVGAKF